MARSSAARVILLTGTVGLALTVINQATAGALDPPLERAAVLAGILSVVLMLVALAPSALEPVPPEMAELDGRQGLELDGAIGEPLATELAWGSRMLLTATPAAVVLLHWGGRTVLQRGLLTDDTFSPGPICRQSQERQRCISLVDLRHYPGRGEFEAVLPGLPSVVVQPLGHEGILLVGGWSARCFSRSDLLWIEGWSERLRGGWAPAFDAAVRAGTGVNGEAPRTG